MGNVLRRHIGEMLNNCSRLRKFWNVVLIFFCYYLKRRKRRPRGSKKGKKNEEGKGKWKGNKTKKEKNTKVIKTKKENKEKKGKEEKKKKKKEKRYKAWVHTKHQTLVQRVVFVNRPLVSGENFIYSFIKAELEGMKQSVCLNGGQTSCNFCQSKILCNLPHLFSVMYKVYKGARH